MELRTLHSKNFAVQIKRWWKPSDRKAARLALAFSEKHAAEISKETSRRELKELAYGHNTISGEHD